MTGATALGLAVAPRGRRRSAGGRAPRHLHRSSVLDGRPRGRRRHGRRRARGRLRPRRAARRPTAATPAPSRSSRGAASSSASARSASASPASSEATTTDTLYDLESMTKVLATATAAMLLVERGKLSLTDAGREVPAALRGQRQGRRARARPAALLVRPARRQPEGRHRRHRRDLALHGGDALEYPTGSMVEYSDLGYRLLGRAHRDGRRHETSTRSRSARSGARSA